MAKKIVSTMECVLSTQVEPVTRKWYTDKATDTLDQCFSTAGPQPGTGPWHQLYRAARGLTKLQYATRFD